MSQSMHHLVKAGQSNALLAPIPPTPLPVDSSGNGTVSCPMNGNATGGICSLISKLHLDNIWTFRQGRAVQSQYDDACISSWYNIHPGWAWQGNVSLPCGSGAPQAYPQALNAGSFLIDWKNTPLVQYMIDQFYGLEVWVQLPDQFYHGFFSQKVWPNNIGGGVLSHSMMLCDVMGPKDTYGGINLNGFYRCYNWGTYAWVSPAFLAGCATHLYAYFSPRQFDPATGIDSKGRHIVDQAVKWARQGGPSISPGLLAQFPPPANPTSFFMFRDTLNKLCVALTTCNALQDSVTH